MGMDQQVTRGYPSPRLSANFFSRLFFWWLKPLFYKGKARDLKHDDLYDTLPSDISEQLGGRLEKYWKNEVENARQSDRKPKLINAIRKTFGWSYFYYAGHMLVLNCLRVLQPYMLGLLIKYFEKGSTIPLEMAYAYASTLVLLTFIHSLLKHHIDLSTLEIGMRLRIACSSLIYRKVIRLANSSMTANTGGQIINLLSNDAAKFDPLFMYLHYIWITPFQGALIAYLIWQNVQVASLAGVLLMALETFPIQVYVGKTASRLRGQIATRTDERVRLLGEIINGIHVIKMYTWEKPFERLVSLARRYEINVITSMSYLRGVNISSNAFIDRTCLFFTILAYVLPGNIITADKIFSMVQYFAILQNLLVYNYPRAIFNAAEARVSIKRIEKFLILEEIRIKAPLLSIEENGSLSLKSVTASWSPNLIVNTLHDITMQIVPKKLYAIVGPIGSGKTSLIQLILGELRSSTGDIKINGTVSYSSQRPWLFPGTVRENIIFDQPYDEVRFQEVIKVCQLERDLERLPYGELAQVGERGTNLSGGQCARISLARAVYRDADIYILDDPFSALDVNVCKYLFNDCVNGYLKNKTRIFVTHQVQCLREADTIVLLNNGKIEYQGTFTNFPKKELHFVNVNDDNGAEQSSEEILKVRNDIVNHVQDNIVSKALKKDRNPEEPHETEELIEKGKIKNSIFLKYFQAGNSRCLLVLTIIFFILAQVIRSGSDYWLAHWTHKEELRYTAIHNTAIYNTTVIPLTNTTETPFLNLTNTEEKSVTTMSVKPWLNTIQSFPIATTSSISNTTQASLTASSSSTTKSILLNATDSLLSYISTNSSISTTEYSLTNPISNAFSNATKTLLFTKTEYPETTTESELPSAFTESLLSTTMETIETTIPSNFIANITESVLPSTLTMTETIATTIAQNLISSTKESALPSAIDFLPKPAESLESNFSHDEILSLTGSDKTDYLDVNLALIIYGCILFGCMLTAVSKVLLLYKNCMNSSKSIHNEMFSCVLRAPMRFFDKQTSGQILNRFSKDTGAMDEILPVTMHESIEVFSVIVGVMVQVIIINYWTIFPIIVTGFLYWRIRNFYLPTAYGIKRLEGAAKSPVLSYVSASLDGLVTIRSGRAQTIVCRRFDARQDIHTRTHFLSIAIASAFGLWLDLVSVLLVGFVTFGCLLTKNSFAGGVGLAITQILMLCGMLQRGIRQTAETITQMTSIERILQFTRLDQEECSSTSPTASKPASSWPSHGKIEFKDFCLRYAENEEPVLQSVNIVIEPGSKIGIVGRTGAGKSSLTSALFRLAWADGQIIIDGIDTRSVGLYDLRKRIAIIPQEPVLFSASLRDNLDPFHEFEDTRLWAALEDVELHKAFVPLDHPIECGGRNLSAGQRQLLCLARAIVKKTRILVLDEATANVDPATDALIRKTIRNTFQDCTVITVAHRLESVIDNDKILVVENGQVAEYDHPHLLLKKEDGNFVRLARQTEEATLEYLKKVSEEAYTRLTSEKSADERTNANGISQNYKNTEIKEHSTEDAP